MSHNILKHSMVYLSGCIDYCENGGVKWRKEITPMLKELGVGVLDPTNKPCPVHKEDENFRNEIARLKNIGNFEEVRRQMKDIVGFDLRMVDYSTFLIAKVDPDITMTGTIWELAYAVQQHKPILLFCDKGVEKIQNWLYGTLDYKYFFNSLSEVVAYLRQVNDGFVKVDYRRWKFLDFSKIF